SRAGDSLGANTAMGRLGPHSFAVLDGLFTGPHRHSPYDHAHHDRTVLCASSSATRSPAAEGPIRHGHIYATLWRRSQSDDVFIIPLLIKELKLLEKRFLARQRYPRKNQNPGCFEMVKNGSYRITIQGTLVDFKRCVGHHLVTGQEVLVHELHKRRI